MKLRLNSRLAIGDAHLVCFHERYLIQLTDSVSHNKYLIDIGDFSGLEARIKNTDNLQINAIVHMIVSDMFNVLGLKPLFDFDCIRRATDSPAQLFEINIISSATPFIVLRNERDELAGTMRFSFNTYPLPFVEGSSVVAITYFRAYSDAACCFLLDFMMKNVVDQPVDQLLERFPGIAVFSQFPAVALRLVEHVPFPDSWRPKVHFFFKHPTIMGKTSILDCRTKLNIKYIANKPRVLCLLLISRRRKTKFPPPEVWALVIEEFIGVM